MDQNTQFIVDYLRDRLSVTELCTLYGVSRKTAYTWIDRYLTHGPQGLEARSRRPRTSPRHTPDHVVAAILEARRRHPSWGAKKLVSILCTRHPRWPWPARSTVCDILSRHHLVPRRRKRRAIGNPGQPTSHITVPNEVWSADFKGHFKTGDGRYCYSLTITDGYSRSRPGGEALSSTCVQEAKLVFTRVFKEFGLPQRIRTDNGVPFATNPLARLSQLSAWWVRLGILPEPIAPGQPQQHGRHERRQRTLNADTTRPPGAKLRAQQRQCNHFREEFNHERPHEALDMHTPAACDEPSPRKMPNKLPPLEYPDRCEVRDVSANGGIRWNHQWVNLSHTCVGEYVGLEEIDDGVWNVSCGPLKLGRLLERHLRIEDVYGRLKRHG
jgi:transposase InsO family protein